MTLEGAAPTLLPPGRLGAIVLGVAALVAGGCGGGPAAGDARVADAPDSDRAGGEERMPLDLGPERDPSADGPREREGGTDADATPNGPVPPPWLTTLVPVERDAGPAADAEAADGGDGPIDDAGSDAPPDAGPPPAGLARHEGGRFLLETAYGSLGMGAEDSLLLLHQPIQGDVELTARLTPGPACLRPGVLMAVTLRETTDAASSYLLVGLSGDGLAVIQTRAFTADFVRTLRQDARAPVPLWLRIGRRGDTFSAAHSPDGSRWTTQSRTLSWLAGGAAELGMALAAGGSSCRVVFDELTVVRSEPPALDAAGADVADGGGGG